MARQREEVRVHEDELWMADHVKKDQLSERCEKPQNTRLCRITLKDRIPS